MYKRGYPCRCASCRSRSTLSMLPAHYIRPRACRVCGCRRWHIDNYRRRREHARYRCECHAFGRYPWGHRRGSKWCVFSTSPPTADEFREHLGGEYELTASELAVWLIEQRQLALGVPAEDTGEIPF